MRPTPPAAVALIKRFEGLHRLLGEGRYGPYLCPANVWTIYAGATRGPDGGPVTRNTPPITAAEGEALLARDLRMFETGVIRLVRLPLTDNQYGALVSFAFNCGLGRLQASTLLRRLNEGRFDQAADEFPKWVMGGGQRLPGLVLRRAAERAMFLTPDPQPEAPPTPASAPRPEGRVARFMRAFEAARAG